MSHNLIYFWINWRHFNYYKLQNLLTPDDDLELSSEDEAVASDLDMHALILGGLHLDQEPLKTADEVIQEIDDMMQEDDSSSDASPECRKSFVDTSETLEKAKEVLSSPLYEDSKSRHFHHSVPL